MKKIIKVGTRKSKLALAQTELVLKALKKIDPSLKFKIIEINTKGDQVHHKPLRDVYEDGKSAFTSEIQKALKQGKIDIAVHSMKDVAGNYREKELEFGAFLKRDSHNDVIILKTKKYKKLEQLPKDFVVGTVSARRKAALLRANKKLQPRNLRGTVQTRIEKLKGKYVWKGHHPMSYDAIVMAKCAIDRSGKDLNLKGLYQFTIPTEQMLPAAGQGTIGVECRKKDKDIFALLRKINHTRTERVTIAEREFLYELGGNCHTVIGVIAEDKAGKINLSAEISDENGKNLFRIKVTGKEPATLGKSTAIKFKKKISDKKGKKFLQDILNLSVKN